MDGRPFRDYPELHAVCRLIGGEETFAVFQRLVVGTPIFLAYVAPITRSVTGEANQNRREG